MKVKYNFLIVICIGMNINEMLLSHNILFHSFLRLLRMRAKREVHRISE